LSEPTIADIIAAKEAMEEADQNYFYSLSGYQADAVWTLGPDRDIKSLALGVGGEAGEVMEIIKKGTRPGKEIDVVHLKEEIGDVLWYLAVLADSLHLDLGEIANENIEKLQKRYGSDNRNTDFGR
jgi:NTP pyrophosphatase (non-canonical NTP hydrolase)